ncbi:MAG TPA: hypothetical protein VHB79_38815 [Polyangiaceae bacterium]|nr:hypothetical protein [Polyangiaceae bacterium]
MDSLYSNRPGRTISGNPLRDGPDLNNPEHMRCAIELLQSSGVELPKPLEAELKRLQQVREVRRLHGFVLAEVERIHAGEDAAAEQAERDRTVTFPSEPAADSDVLVIGEGLNRYPGGEDSAREVDGKIYQFYAHSLLHFVPQEVAAAWPHRRGLPGHAFTHGWPTDLIRSYKYDFTRLRAGGSQGTGPGYSESETDEKGLLSYVSRIVRECSHVPLLEIWLATAKAAGDDLNATLARVLEQQLEKLSSADDADDEESAA